MSSVSSLNSLLSSSSTSSNASSIDISSLLAAATGASSTGIDVTSAVDAAIYAAQAPERQWQAQQATLQSQITAIGSIQSSLSAVSQDLQNLNDPQGVLASRTVSSSNSSEVEATATPGANVGNHVISVQSLATSASWYSSPVTSANASLGTSTLVITQSGGEQTSLQLGGDATDTLSALINTINADSLGVTADVITDSTGSRLALVSNTSGASSNFTVADESSTASSWSSASVASSSSVVNASSVQISDGDSSATIQIPPGTSLAALSNTINGEGLNLTASVVSDDSGVHLSIASKDGNSVTVSSDPTLSLTQPREGSDASLTVDGVPVTSASNTISGAVSGLTLNLQGITSGVPVTLGVTADATQISSSVSQFVNDYNSAVSLVNSQFTYSTSNGAQGALGSDGTVRSLQSALLGIGSYSTSNAAGTNAAITSLSDLGISMNDDGTLTLDTSNLDQALATNPTGVQDFFQGTSLNGFANSIESSLNAFNDPATGALTLDSSSMTQQYNDLETDVNNYESGYIASQRTVLTSMYSQAEIALQQLPTTLKQLQAQLGQNSGS